MKNILFCILLASSPLHSQSLKWYEGAVVLTSDNVLTGKISVDPLHSIVLLQEQGADHKTVYPAHKIRSLYYYDETENINRRFLVMKEQEVLWNNYQLFEIVLFGEVTVLRRQNTKGTRPSDALDFSYYVDYNNEIVALQKFRRRIYPHLIADDARLEDFISQNNLKSDTDANSIRIIEYYNQLIAADEAIAKH